MPIPRSSFYGITILQTAVYYKVNPNDPRIFRYTVMESDLSHWTLLMKYRLPFYGTLRMYTKLYLDPLQSAGSSIRSMLPLSTHALYFYLIESFGNYLDLLKVIWYVNHRLGNPSSSDFKFACRSFPVTLFSRFVVM